MGGGILLLTGFIAATMLRPSSNTAVAAASATPTVRPTPASTPSPTPEPTAVPTATVEPTPTPVPTPAGPPMEVAVGGWATVTTGELNVRRGAGTDQEALYRLVKGAIVHIAEGPAVVDGGNWYRVSSLGGASGWVFSGWLAEPYLDTIVNDPVLIRCGEVTEPVFEAVDGAARPRDPVRIGAMALPAAGFSEMSLSVLELMRGVGAEACFSAQVGSDGTAVIDSELNAGACGHAVAEGSFFHLRPSASGTMPLSSQVKDPVILHPAVLHGGPPDDRKSTNLRAVVSIMANDGVNGCIHASVTNRAGNEVSWRSVDAAQCSIVEEYNRDNIKLRPAGGGELAWIKLSSDGFERGRFPLDTPVMVSVSASVASDQRSAYAWPSDGACP